MLEITLKSLTLPERQEEADKYLESLRVSYNKTAHLYQECAEKMDDIVEMLSHLEALYNKKWRKP